MSKKAVMIIHGFMSNLKEIQYLSDIIKQNSNIDVYTFTLPGHDDYSFKNIKYQDWIKSSEEMLMNLKKSYNSIYIIGHSMGGVIASHLASKNKEVKKLVLVAPSFKYLELFEDLNILKEKINDTIKNKTKYKDITQRILNSSVTSVIEFRKLVKTYYEEPKNINCPTLLIHGEKDLVVPIKSSKYVYDSIKSKTKYLKIIKGADHSLLYDYKKEYVTRYICNFLKGGLLWIITKNLNI